jgi:hypothetical protein
MAAHYTLTLTTGTPVKMSTAVTGDSADFVLPAAKFLSFQADPANTHVIYIGGTNATLTSSNFGFRIEIPVTSIPPAPSVRELSSDARNLNQYYALGTTGEKLHIFVD